MVEVQGREQDHKLRERYAEVRCACWEFLLVWRPAASPGNGHLHQLQKGCHTVRCWKAFGPPQPLEHKERLGTLLAFEEEV